MTPWLRSSQGNHSRQQYTNNQQQTRLKNAKLILHHKYETAPHHYPFSFPFRRGTNERVGNCVPFPANRGPGCCRHALHPLPHSTSHASPSRFPNRPQLVPLNTTQDSSTTHSLLASASRQTPGLSEWKKEGRKEGREPESASSFVVVVVTTHRTKTPSGVRGHRPSINFRRFFDSSIFRFFDFFAIFKNRRNNFLDGGCRRRSSLFVFVVRRSNCNALEHPAFVSLGASTDNAMFDCYSKRRPAGVGKPFPTLRRFDHSCGEELQIRGYVLRVCVCHG